MKNSLTLLLAWGLLLALPVSAEDARVQGALELVDESDRPWARFRLPVFVDVLFHYGSESAGGVVSCPGQGKVDSDSWNFEFLIPDACEGRELRTRVRIRPALDWIEIPPSPRVVWEDQVRLYQLSVRVRRPRNLTTASRQRYFQKGQALFPSEPAEAIAYFAEAARGEDIEFTSAAANYLEAADAQHRVYDLLATKDLESLRIDDRTRFRFAMRKGHAARAAGLVTPALASYGQAQMVFPQAHEPVGFAYTVALQEVGANGPTDLSSLLAAQPDLWNQFQGVLIHWKDAGIRCQPGTAPTDCREILTLAGSRAARLAGSAYPADPGYSQLADHAYESPANSREVGPDIGVFGGAADLAEAAEVDEGDGDN